MVRYILMPYETGWQVVNERNGRVVGLFLVRSDAQAYLKMQGLERVERRAGEVEVWGENERWS